MAGYNEIELSRITAIPTTRPLPAQSTSKLAVKFETTYSNQSFGGKE